MSREQFRSTNFRAESLRDIGRINDVLDEYDGQRLTSRQVFYQFVSRGWIDNTERSYKKMTGLITDARYAGMVSWDAIEDRGREPDVPGEWSSVDSVVDIALEQFRLPRWADQPSYVELWVEKQALAGVLSPIARRNHVPLMVNKGYSSASAMKDAADRMLAAVGAHVEVVCDACEHHFHDDRHHNGKCDGCGSRSGPMALAISDEGDGIDKNVVLLYLGDHDPSGEDMVRDIRDRLQEFGVPNLEVKKLALTMSQIRRFNPPPNPAKVTDSRAAAYIAKHGDSSWELDALPPRELNRIVEKAILEVVDVKAMSAVIRREDAERERVTKAIAKSRKAKQ